MSRWMLFCLTMAWIVCAYAQTSINPGTSQTLPLTDDDFIKKLIADTGCRPLGETKCEVSVKSVGELFRYLSHCKALSGWIIHFAHSEVVKLDLIGGGDSCQMIFTDSHFPESPQTVVCKFTQDEINKMLQDFSTSDALQQYEQSGQTVNEDLLRKAKPIVDCIKPIAEMNKYIKYPAQEGNTNPKPPITTNPNSSQPENAPTETLN